MTVTETSWEEAGPLWAKTLSERGETTAIFDPEGSPAATFAELDRWSLEFAEEFEKLGFSGRVVSFRLGNTVVWPAVLLALWRANALPLLAGLAKPRAADAFQHLEKLTGAVARIQAPDPFQDEPFHIHPLGFPKTRLPWNAHLLKSTSGSTGASKAIGFLVRQLHADSRQICDTMEISREDLNFGVIPFAHSYGFSNLISPLLFHGIPMVCSNDPLPRALVENLAATRATVWPAVPAMFPGVAASGTQLPDSLRLVLSAGAPLLLSTAKEFFDATGKKIHAFYGSSECGGICYDREGRAGEIEGWVGTPLSGISIREIPREESTGVTLRITGETIGLGMFPNEEEESLDDGSFTPGDLLRFQNGGYVLLGRLDDIINVGGKKVAPLQVESALLRLSGVRSAVVFGVPVSGGRGHEIFALVERTEIIPESEMRTLLSEFLADWQIPRKIIPVSRIPSNERGKLSRKQLAQQFST